MDFQIAEDVRALGVRCVCLVMSGLRNAESDPELEAIKERTSREILAGLSLEAIERDPILQGFRHLHDAVGVSKKELSSAEALRRMLLKRGGMPKINIVVDLYNLLSLSTRLSLGAHDVAKIAGNVRLRRARGDERFVPLGSPEPKPVRAGEYVYADDAEVICRLETRQVEKTKVGLDSGSCFFIVQGNAATDGAHIRAAAAELVALTQRFCGGERCGFWDCA